MNSKGDTSVLNTIIGTLIGIGVAVITISIIFSLIKVGNPEQDKLIELAQKVKEVSTQEPGASGLMVYFLGESYFYLVTKETRNKMLLDYNKPVTKEIIVTPETSVLQGQIIYVLSHPTKFPDCETQNCLCLCQEFDEEVVKHCLPGKLICEPLPDISLSPGTEVLLKKTDETPAMQQVQIIKCRGKDRDRKDSNGGKDSNVEKYCKNSKKGDISIIFNWLDQKGVYDSIK